MLDFPNITRVRRHLLSFGVVLTLLPAFVAPVVHADPVRNLVVEWRLNGQAHGTAQGVGTGPGHVVIDSQQGVSGRAPVQAGTWQTRGHSQSIQRVQVLNGGHARLFIGHSEPNLVWQWSGDVGDGQRPRHHGEHSSGYASFHTEWWSLGQGLDVKPRWPGGRSPVTVELSADSSRRSAYEPDGQIRQTQVSSTLIVPLGEWAEVARSGARQHAARSGAWSIETREDARTDRLEIRITAP